MLYNVRAGLGSGFRRRPGIGHRIRQRSQNTKKMIKIIVGENEAGQRVDRFLRKYLKGAPLSRIYRIIRKDLKVNGRRVREEEGAGA